MLPHVTAGDGLDVFAAWSKTDPDFTKTTMIARRWNSCDAKKESGCGIGTLRNIFLRQGFAARVLLPPVQGGAAEDFDAAGVTWTPMRRTMNGRSS